MPEYRKRGTRQFFKLHDDIMTLVINQQLTSKVVVTTEYLSIEAVFGKDDIEYSKPCTEEEFNAAKSEAMKRLQSEQI